MAMHWGLQQNEVYDRALPCYQISLNNLTPLWLFAPAANRNSTFLCSAPDLGLAQPLLDDDP
jgi:hypothetical protein